MSLTRIAIVCGGALVALSLFAVPNTASARPQYLKAFAEKYPELKAEATTAKCGVCHYGDSKKNNNDYGKATKAALGAENVKDTAAIAKAFDDVEPVKNDAGKTFGDLIKKEKKLPGTNPE